MQPTPRRGFPWIAAMAIVGMVPAVIGPAARLAPFQDRPDATTTAVSSPEVTADPPASSPGPGAATSLVPRSASASGAPSATPEHLVDARGYGAVGDGEANDTAAIQAAIGAAAADGGGLVYLEPGTYLVSQLKLAANVALHGAGTGRTTVRAIGDDGLPTIVARGVGGVEISNLTVVGRGVAGGRGDEILVNLVDAIDARVIDVHIDRAQGIGLQVEGSGSSNGVYEDVRITNTFIRGNGFHGVAFWFYAGPHHNRVEGLTTDTSDGPGLMLDAGTTVGAGAEVADNVLTDITVLRAARHPGGAGVVLAGASRNSLIRFRIDDTAAHNTVALTIQQDQTGVPAEHNLIAEGTISGVGGSAFDLESSSRNTIRDVSVRDIGLIAPARLIQLTSTAVNPGQTSLPTTDNIFRRLTLHQTTGNYAYGVRLDSLGTPVVRNRFEAIEWGTPRRGVIERLGSDAPLTGVDANVL
ncbi:MAG TPA: glycosyl hydrolase family 28-related protein [Candidatus Limnocylindrales bacterium]|nr:glycosyl hydrolase family 28-related protein [Candidatus Limnocylindrales bacterium]